MKGLNKVGPAQIRRREVGGGEVILAVFSISFYSVYAKSM